ncbi:MAG: UDP-N-acetylmuramoyl-L-alanine--D-glutamate ligase [Flavobacteriia bacterium]|nr:UDP-N-acetylmuramoyl-L-alanine--D-glutamate ligase [Flavobacteriia bacterium]
MQKENKHIAILGSGESGVGAAVLAIKMGWDVFVSDNGKIKEEYIKELNEINVEWEENGHDEERILKSDIIIKSPGIPNTIPLITKAIQKKIKIISEIEFASFYCKAKKIAITGSNGKTTTTLLLYHILKKAGLNVGLAGNVGKSYAKQVAQENFDYYVIELSSFQLDDMYDFKSDIAILTNITPDHLDRYQYQMQNYVNSKFRITQNQTDNEYFIYNLDDKIIVEELKKRTIQAKCIPFSLNQKVSEGGYLDENQLVITIKEPLIMSIHDLALKGKHNAQNSLAAGIAAKLLEIRNDSLRESFSDFVNVEHRLEFVAKVNGIEFINDSKATNVNSTWYALECITKPIVWIVGGIDKGNDYSELESLVKDKVKAIICLGKDNKKIIDYFSGIKDQIVEAHSALEAVAYAYRFAKKEECVLLSPACASFDLFESYEDRGNQFKAAVRSL